MSFLLDTNILSHHMRGAPRLTHRLIQHSGRLAMPAALRRRLPEKGPLASAHSDRRLALFYRRHRVRRDCARTFGRLRGDLHGRAIIVPPIDLLIASVALTHDLTLVTNNTADFANIPDLRVIDWLAS